MEVKIGVQNAPRELVIDTDGRRRRRREAGRRARSPTAACWPSPTAKGRRVVVPADKLAYVEIGDGATGQVGFRS